MKLTKYVHACLLAEDNGVTALFDPGQFSWESGLFDVNRLAKLDYIVITHEHFDHFNLPFITALLQKFPDVRIISTASVVRKLAEAGITNASSEGTEDVVIFSKVLHADLTPLGQAPENIAVHFRGKLTVGGDRHDLEESKEILALAMTGPWGSMVGAAAMALRLKPKVLVPVHDWHWNDKARQGAYDSFKQFFSGQSITFISTVDGQPFNIPEA